MHKVNLLLRTTLIAFLAGLAAACHQSLPPAGNTAFPVASPLATVANAAPAQTPAPNPETDMPRTQVEAAKAQVAKGTAVIIDVRGTDAYKIAHVKGALDYPLMRLEQSDFKDLPK